RRAGPGPGAEGFSTGPGGWARAGASPRLDGQGNRPVTGLLPCRRHPGGTGTGAVRILAPAAATPSPSGNPSVPPRPRSKRRCSSRPPSRSSPWSSPESFSSSCSRGSGRRCGGAEAEAVVDWVGPVEPPAATEHPFALRYRLPSGAEHVQRFERGFDGVVPAPGWRVRVRFDPADPGNVEISDNPYTGPLPGAPAPKEPGPVAR